MKPITLNEVAKACCGSLHGDPDIKITSIVTDSRQARAGSLFAAIKGARADGHRFIPMTVEQGAVCVLCEEAPTVDTPYILVDSTLVALKGIAEYYRSLFSIPFIGITGSVGKTSTKEFISAVLAQKYKVHKTAGNFNNELGVPLTLFGLEEDHEVAVIEMGISGFGEMRSLARIVKPTIGVFTVIGHAHLEFLHDRQGVLRAKTEMLEEMEDDALVIVNGDDDLLRDFPTRQRKLCFGMSRDCEVRAEEISVNPEGYSVCSIVYGERRFPVTIPSFGQHMIYAALEGAAVGFALGLSDGEIARGIASFATVGRRSAVTETGSITLIDDSYNANPDSVKCGMDSLVQLPGRHLAILGDMLELGEQEKEMHRDVGRYAAQKGIELVLCQGPLAREMAEGAGERGRWFETKAALIAALPSLIRQGDKVLVKASRGMRFEEIAEALKQL